MFYTLIKHGFCDQSERAQGPIHVINFVNSYLEGTVIRATLFFNLSRNIVALQVKPSVAPITVILLFTTFVANLSRNKIQCCKSAEFTRTIGQSSVIKDGSFFHII